MKLKIRKRERRGYVKEAQGYTSWTEWQVYNVRIVARFETKEAAEKFVAETEAKP